jgi:hypothetical protein
MARRTKIIVVAVTAAIVAFLPSLADAPSSAPASMQQEPPSERIRIEHTYVRIPDNRRPPRAVQARDDSARRPGRARVQRAPQDRAAPAPRTESNTAASGILIRAAKAVVGDGRYTPQPFPRPVR